MRQAVSEESENSRMLATLGPSVQQGTAMDATEICANSFPWSNFLPQIWEGVGFSFLIISHEKKLSAHGNLAYPWNYTCLYAGTFICGRLFKHIAFPQLYPEVVHSWKKNYCWSLWIINWIQISSRERLLVSLIANIICSFNFSI